MQGKNLCQRLLNREPLGGGASPSQEEPQAAPDSPGSPPAPAPAPAPSGAGQSPEMSEEDALALALALSEQGM